MKILSILLILFLLSPLTAAEKNRVQFDSVAFEKEFNLIRTENDRYSYLDNDDFGITLLLSKDISGNLRIYVTATIKRIEGQKSSLEIIPGVKAYHTTYLYDLDFKHFGKDILKQWRYLLEKIQITATENYRSFKKGVSELSKKNLVQKAYFKGDEKIESYTGKGIEVKISKNSEGYLIVLEKGSEYIVLATPFTFEENIELFKLIDSFTFSHIKKKMGLKHFNEHRTDKNLCKIYQPIEKTIEIALDFSKETKELKAYSVSCINKK